MLDIKRRILLCRPQGGLNDVLCQIEKCWDYAERFERRLIIDTSRRKLIGAVFDLLSLKDSPSNVEMGIPPGFGSVVESLSVLPAGLTNGLLTDKPRWRGGKFVCGESDEAITFDFSRDHEEDLLVHHQAGGGVASHRAITRFQVSRQNVELILGRMPQLPQDYDSLHIRATDYQTDYLAFLLRLARKKTDLPLVVCSDSNEVLDSAKNVVPRRPIITFDDHPIDGSLPLHRDSTNYSDSLLKEAGQRLLAEMLTLTGARTFHYGPVFVRSGTEPTRFSGFSRLLAFITTHPQVRRDFFGTELVGSEEIPPGRTKIMLRRRAKTVHGVKQLVRRFPGSPID